MRRELPGESGSSSTAIQRVEHLCGRKSSMRKEQGHYEVMLGSTGSEGIPLDLFTSGEARWWRCRRCARGGR
jgi:hypothetical protein